MKKIYSLQNLDCANCASKLENSIGKVDGVNNVVINFWLQKMELEIRDDKVEEILKKVKEISKTIEPDLEMVER